MSDSLADIWKLKERGKRDSQRHDELVKRAIREHGKDVITEYNIIKYSGSKKVKIPIRFLDKYTIRYGKWKNKSKVGQGVDVKKGQKYRRNQQQEQKPGGGKAGDKEGDVGYEAELSVDELVSMLLEELNLPWMESKESEVIEVINEEVTSIDKKGIFPNLDIKRTLMENLKRNAALGNPKIGDFANDDLRYKTWEEEIEYTSNAAIFLMMDRSGSMTDDKAHIAKSFYFWMVQFLKRRYKNIDLIFIAHDAVAREVTEDEFFAINSAGGTKCSSAFELALKIIKEKYPPERWNTYIAEFSDGDNYGTDNTRCVELVNELLPLCTAIGYGEIILDSSTIFSWRSEDDMLYSVFKKNIKRTRFVPMRLKKKDDVFDALRYFFNVDGIAKKM